MNKTFLISFLVFLSSCFIGADTYEKEINDFFWLYSDTYKTNNISLGTKEREYRFGDGYIISVKNVGWDSSFLIVETHQGQFYIQDLRKLAKLSNDQYNKFLYGPLTKAEFAQKRNALLVDLNLEFEIEY